MFDYKAYSAEAANCYQFKLTDGSVFYVWNDEDELSYRLDKPECSYARTANIYENTIESELDFDDPCLYRSTEFQEPSEKYPNGRSLNFLKFVCSS